MNTELVKIENSISETRNSKGQLLDAFISFVDVQSDASRSTYRRSLSHFFGWIEETGRVLGDLDRNDILQYRHNLLWKDEKGTVENLSPLTTNSYLVAVRRFFEWAEGAKLYPNIAKGVKGAKRKQEFVKQHLTNGQVRNLLAYEQEKTSTREQHSKRDLAIISLLVFNGLRTAEVVRADIRDLETITTDDLNGNPITRRVLWVRGKGHNEKDTSVILQENVWKSVLDYLDEDRKNAADSEPLFVSASRQNAGQRLTTRTISGLAKEGLVAVGVADENNKRQSRKYTAHSLRHTCACNILKNGGSIFDVQTVLRHATPATSEIYLRSIERDAHLSNAPEMLVKF